MLCPGSFYAQSVVVSVVFRFFRKFINDPLAQLAEQLPFKQWVRGSNPRRVTRNTSNPQWGSDVFLIGSAGDPNGSIAAVRWTAASAGGNRRRFDALHYEVTFENVVKAMKEDMPWQGMPWIAPVENLSPS